MRGWPEAAARQLPGGWPLPPQPPQTALSQTGMRGACHPACCPPGMTSHWEGSQGAGRLALSHPATWRRRRRQGPPLTQTQAGAAAAGAAAPGRGPLVRTVLWLLWAQCGDSKRAQQRLACEQSGPPFGVASVLAELMRRETEGIQSFVYMHVRWCMLRACSSSRSSGGCPSRSAADACGTDFRSPARLQAHLITAHHHEQAGVKL